MLDRLQQLADQIAETTSKLSPDDPWHNEMLISSAFIQRRYLFPETVELSASFIPAAEDDDDPGRDGAANRQDRRPPR